MTRFRPHVMGTGFNFAIHQIWNYPIAPFADFSSDLEIYNKYWCEVTFIEKAIVLKQPFTSVTSLY